ncbi:MAG: C-type polyheme cytochrome OmcB [Deltaproteobacteria bacterium]|nr:C-type polyheme cytochrome OmcB [Deltaproteobacteria bacterium]
MSYRAKHFFAMLALSLLATAFSGCGSGNREGASHVVDKVGDSTCIQCHSSVTEALTGESIVSQYQKSSPHNTPELGCESCHGGGAMHNGVGPIPFPRPDANRCASCHDGVTAPATNSNTDFITSNHAVGTPSQTDIDTACLRCHTHEGAVLGNIAGWTGTKDVITDATIQGKITFPSTEYTGFNCDTCHEHGAGLRAVKGTTTAGGTVVNWNPNNNTNFRDQFDLCTSCHTFYNYNGSLLLVDGNPLTAGGGNIPTGLVGNHETTWYRILASTHYDNPNTGVGLTANVIEGYNVRKTSANPCFDCHAHEAKTNTSTAGTSPADATIHTDWAQSAHAGGLLSNKYANASSVATVMAAGVIDDASGAAWAHYNWDKTLKPETPATDPPTYVDDRGSCQRCHTSTGASNYMNNPTGYKPANNTFSHLSGWEATTGSPQNELLYCWGCHSNAGKGILRKPGAITEIYGAATAGDSATIVSYPDISGSNTCMTCHLGRETGEVIKKDKDPDGVRSFVNSHYLSAGGQLFGTTGYEYAGVSYANLSFFAHDKVGSAAAPGTGSNGPCAGCHMSTPNSHSFLPVTKNTSGAITAITSTACATCHRGGLALTPAGLTTEEEGYQAALSALVASLDGHYIYFYPAHPYFYKDSNNNKIFDLGEDFNRNGVLDADEDVNSNGLLDKGVDNDVTSGESSDAFTGWASIYGFDLWKDVMGAAFNANLLIHDPGGYVHNRIYSKRLIRDSIDFIYDGVLNNNVIAAIDAQVTASRLDSASAEKAKTYLGATRP